MASEPRLPEETSLDGSPRRRFDHLSLTSLMAARLLRLRPQHGPRRAGERKPDNLMIPRWALSLAILLTLLLFLALLVLFFLPTEARASKEDGINFDKPTKDWYQGPVRYIITKAEVKAYKALESDADRANFIDWFWQRRDIEPATPENEWRARFEQRTLEATRKFSFTTKPGWKTDMGKIYILVGPPDEINAEYMAKSSRGTVIWVYRKPPFPDMPTNTVIGFAKDPSGEFVLSTSPTLDSDVARGLQFNSVKLTDDGQMMIPGIDPLLTASGQALNQTELMTQMVYGRMQQLPPREEELFQSFVATKEFYGAIPADTRVDYYQAADGTTYATLTVGIRSASVQYRSKDGKEKPDVGVFGKLISRENPDQVYPLASNTAFAESSSNENAGSADTLIFQASGGFKPGRYQLVLGVEDHVSKRLAAYRKDIEIPDLSGKTLALSSITVAGEMEPTDYAPSGGKPFFLGRFRVVPKPNGVFLTTDTLNLYFHIYNPATDATSGQPNLDILYSFRMKQGDGKFKEVGKYEVKASTAQVQGYAVPLAKWPVGDYQVAVMVSDKVGGTSTSGAGLFTIHD